MTQGTRELCLTKRQVRKVGVALGCPGFLEVGHKHNAEYRQGLEKLVTEAPHEIVWASRALLRGRPAEEETEAAQPNTVEADDRRQR